MKNNLSISDIASHLEFEDWNMDVYDKMLVRIKSEKPDLYATLTKLALTDMVLHALITEWIWHVDWILAWNAYFEEEISYVLSLYKEFSKKVVH